MKIVSLLAIVIAAFPATGFSQTIITTEDGDGADALVRRGDADANYGGSTLVEVRDASSTSDRKGYLRFDLSAWTGSVVTDAQLDMIWLGGSSSTQTIRFYGLNDGHAGESWIEGTGNETTATSGEITWDTAPANNTGSSLSFTSDATFLGGFTFDFSTLSAGDTLAVTDSDLGGSLSTFIEADSNNLLTIMMSIDDGNGGDYFQIASKENATFDAPALTIVPEPSTLAAVGLGSLFLLIRRRRK